MTVSKIEKSSPVWRIWPVAIRRRSVVQLAALAGLAALSLSGCSSLSDSLSESSSSPFQWSSKSSKSSFDTVAAYQGDVRDYTAAYLRSSRDLVAFRQGLSTVASRHGVTDWEADRATYAGIGAGIGKANLAGAELEAFIVTLSNGDARLAAAIREGYDARRKDRLG